MGKRRRKHINPKERSPPQWMCFLIYSSSGSFGLDAETDFKRGFAVIARKFSLRYAYLWGAGQCWGSVWNLLKSKAGDFLDIARAVIIAIIRSTWV
jgi:hypothetical protein